jgi:predicted metal-binding membrane protein
MRSVQLSKQEKIIILALVFLSVVAWIITVYHSRNMDSYSSMEMQMSMGMEHPTLILETSLFLVMWVVMMIAMMFPAVVPMVLIFSNVHRKRRTRNESFIPTWVFVLGYLLIWTFFGFLACFVSLVVRYLDVSFPRLQEYKFLIRGVVLIVVGLYQITPLKNVCLTHCRSPFHFIMGRWREGYLGSLIMGIDHGAYCIGCCWGLMLILFVVGIMNIAWMGVLTSIIFIEKISKHGVIISKIIGVLLILLGIIMAFEPELHQFFK